MSGIYEKLAGVYDSINNGIDYESWADFIVALNRKYTSRPGGRLALDLACGTGSMTLALAERGFDMTGADISGEMLAFAAAKAAETEKNILFLKQDMRSFELYGGMDLIVCCLDSLNHLTSPRDLNKTFSLVHNYLEYGGIFIFDVNTPYKFENVYGENSFIIEGTDSDYFCGWQNFFDKSRGTCEFRLSYFETDGNGKYTRSDMVQRERCYSMRSLRSALSRAGLTFMGAFGDFEMSEAAPDDERWYIAAKKEK